MGAPRPGESLLRADRSQTISPRRSWFAVVTSLVLLTALGTTRAAGHFSSQRFPELPYDLSRVKGMDGKDLPEEARELLSRNGFVVYGPPKGDMSRCYHANRPVFITVDSVIELFLLEFERAWGRLEIQQATKLIAAQKTLWNRLLDRWDALPPGPARDAAHRLLGLIAVGRSLVEPNWAVADDLPHGLPADVDREELRKAWRSDVMAIRKQSQPSKSVLWDRTVDWSSFKPSGPYAGNDTLRTYFTLSQWWGLHALRSRDPQERLCAAILAWLHPPELSTLEATYDRFLGPVNSVPLHYLRSPETWSQEGHLALQLPQAFGTDAFDGALVARLASHPLPRVYADAPEGYLDPARGQGVRLLPPRLLVGSCALADVTDITFVDRIRPRALDMLACFGNDRAKHLTLISVESRNTKAWLRARIKAYRSQAAPEQEYGRFQAVLKELLCAIAEPEEIEGQPLFFGTTAYRDRAIAGALATWAGMRELVHPRGVTQVSVAGLAEEVPGIVEPNLPAWQRLIELCAAAKEAFGRYPSHHGAMSGQALDTAIVCRRIAEKQLTGSFLTSHEQEFLQEYATWLYCALREYDPAVQRSACVPFARSWIPDAVRWAGKSCSQILAVVEYQGELVLCTGGVFNYHEFDLPPGQSLSREDFTKLLSAPNAPASPSWTSSFRVESRQ